MSALLLSLLLSSAPIERQIAEARPRGLRADTPAQPAETRPLSEFAQDRSPWKRIEAYSEQRPPTYLGKTPRDLALTQSAGPQSLSLPEFMKSRLEDAALELRKGLRLQAIEFEAWPSVNDWGPAWVFARWRKSSDTPWQWIDPAQADRFDDEESAPVLPLELKLASDSGFGKVFNDPSRFANLYAKPAFSECVFTTADGSSIYGAWLPSSSREPSARSLRNAIGRRKNTLCHSVPRPAHTDGGPVTFVIRVEGNRVTIPREILWTQYADAPPSPPRSSAVITSWPDDFTNKYKNDLAAYSGAAEIKRPSTGATIRLKRKNAAQSDHQLDDVVAWLEARYAGLRITTQRQMVTWNGVTSSNLLAIIPGSLPPGRNRPVILADHIDTAFAEEVFSASKKRQAVPGADDNGTAVAALLRAAEILPATRPLHDIWLLHLTGEEFPSDCSGARTWTSSMLQARRDLGAIVIMDMIGYNPRNHPLFQINSGKSTESQAISGLAFAVSREVAPHLTPAYRSPYNAKNYIGNTDGAVFSDAGYPVVFLNEHINDLENINRKHYHQMTDTIDRINFPFATSIAKIAIETAARLAQRP